MADSDQILQLGIEEARNGNRDEARNLFELLTRQEPNNAQGWLWLAGVADNPDQRRAALQRVLELDPNNDMARKGLQAMGVSTTVGPAEAVVEPAGVADDDAVVVTPEPDRPRTADEDFADQLDSAFDDYDALPRAQAPVRTEEELAEAAAASRVTTERPSVRSSRLEFDDDDDEPVRRGPHPLLWVLVALIGAVLLGFIVLSFMGGGGGIVGRPTSEPGQVATSATGEQPTSATGEQPTTATGEQPTTATGEQPTAAPGEQPTSATGEQPTAAPGEQPTAAPGEQPTAAPGEQPTAAPGVPPEQANPAPVAPGTVAEAANWSYTFPNANYAVYLGNQAGGQTAQGEFVHVLMFVTNNTGTAQPIPADFFVLKDSQGRVFNTRPDVSNALVQRGVNADLSMTDAVPANGTTTSIYLVFDVASDANGLVLFAQPNPNQGWQLTPIR